MDEDGWMDAGPRAKADGAGGAATHAEGHRCHWQSSGRCSLLLILLAVLPLGGAPVELTAAPSPLQLYVVTYPFLPESEGS